MNKNSEQGTARQLCEYTTCVLSQMVSLIDPYIEGNQSQYAVHVGAHIRHIIEHYDTLVKALEAAKTQAETVAKADYDARERSLEVEANPLEAVRRIGQIENALGLSADLNQAALLLPIDVHTRGGLKGEYNFSTVSSVAREIMFLNSHATHHFAILQGYARERGETLGAGVGKAPATVAHEQRLLKSRETA